MFESCYWEHIISSSAGFLFLGKTPFTWNVPSRYLPNFFWDPSRSDDCHNLFVNRSILVRSKLSRNSMFSRTAHQGLMLLDAFACCFAFQQCGFPLLGWNKRKAISYCSKFPVWNNPASPICGIHGEMVLELRNCIGIGLGIAFITQTAKLGCCLQSSGELVCACKFIIFICLICMTSFVKHCFAQVSLQNVQTKKW